jgi:hypothetical protein
LLGYQFNVNAFELLDVSEELGEKSHEELLTSTSAELAIRCCGSRYQHLARRFYRRRCPLQGIHMLILIRLHSAAATPSPAAFKTGKLKFKICTEKQFKVQIIVDLRKGPTVTVTVSPPAPSYLRREGELSRQQRATRAAAPLLQCVRNGLCVIGPTALRLIINLTLTNTMHASLCHLLVLENSLELLCNAPKITTLSRS